MIDTPNYVVVKDPVGRNIEIPVSVDSLDDVYLKLTTQESVNDYFSENGYVILRNMIKPELCDFVHQSFLNEVKPYKGFIYRQASANPEKHAFSNDGFMMNAILNIQSLGSGVFKKFKENGMAVLTNSALMNVLTEMMHDRPKLVQSMYFEGNPATWAHQDSYYLDSENYNMIAAWIALENITPEAGRFYICPGTHKLDLEKNGGDFDIAFNHDKYKQLISEMMLDNKINIVAPALNKGDVLLWHGKTIHGSLPTTQNNHSRNSFTAHYIPQGEKFLQYQRLIKPLALKKINDIDVNHPKDLDNVKNRIIMFTETTFPKTFQYIKRLAIKILLR